MIGRYAEKVGRWWKIRPPAADSSRRCTGARPTADKIVWESRCSPRAEAPFERNTFSGGRPILRTPFDPVHRLRLPLLFRCFSSSVPRRILPSRFKLFTYHIDHFFPTIIAVHLALRNFTPRHLLRAVTASHTRTRLVIRLTLCTR